METFFRIIGIKYIIDPGFETPNAAAGSTSKEDKELETKQSHDQCARFYFSTNVQVKVYTEFMHARTAT